MATKETMFRGSLAAAEASRDRRAYSGFISGLFEGIVRRRLFADASVPTMSGAATEFLATLRLLLTDKVDPEVIDRTGEIGEDVLAAFKQIGAFGIKIPRGELFPEQMDPAFVQDGKLNDAGLAEVRRRMPDTDLSELERTRDVNLIANLFSVQDIVAYLEKKTAAA